MNKLEKAKSFSYNLLRGVYVSAFWALLFLILVFVPILIPIVLITGLIFLIVFFYRKRLKRAGTFRVDFDENSFGNYATKDEKQAKIGLGEFMKQVGIEILKHDYTPALLLTTGIFCLFFSIPALIIHWTFHPVLHKKSIQIAVLFISVGVSIFYYHYNSDKFNSISDRVGYFTGVALFPTGVLEILL